MKSRYWFLVIGVILLISGALCVQFYIPGQASTTAEIWSDKHLIRTVALDRNQTFTVETADGYNVVTVKDGKIAVTDADCPDHYCMHRGYCNGGAPIVCLPHRLVIQFAAGEGVDGVVG